VLQASPLLGILFGGIAYDRVFLVRIALLLVGSLALTAHVFVFNDWAGHAADARDPRRAAQLFGRSAISSGEVAFLAVALLIVSMLAMALVSVSALLLATGIACLSVFYSTFGKGRPILASLLHVVGGALHFLLGYTAGHAVDHTGLAIALFFGLVFAGGHLNQEVRDYDADRCNRIRTTAVVFGPRRAFVASLLVFTSAYLLLVLLGLRGILASPLIWAVLLWPGHLICALRILRRDVGFEAAIWMQRWYRLEFALLGLAMAFTTPPMMDLARCVHQQTTNKIHYRVPARKTPAG